MLEFSRMRSRGGAECRKGCQGIPINLHMLIPQRCKPYSNSALRRVRLMNLEPRSPLSLSIIFASCICFHFTDPRYTRRCSQGLRIRRVGAGWPPLYGLCHGMSLPPSLHLESALIELVLESAPEHTIPIGAEKSPGQEGE